MESKSLFSSPLHHSLSFIPKKLQTHQLPSVSSPNLQRIQKFGAIKRSSGIAYSSRNRDWHEREMAVDESMIVLRKRIHEMKMIERNYEPPSEWMNWEKQCYTSYDDSICKFVGFLQFHLMNIRPCLALAMFFVLSISVPVSTVTISFQLLDVVNGVLSAVHLG